MSVAAAVVVLLVAGLAACGGGDDSSSTLTGAEAASPGQSGQGSSGEGSSRAGSGNSGGGSPGSAGVERKSASRSEEAEADAFVPKQHNDSGGGAEQFNVKGVENSAPEFGRESSASELAAAATGLHNFFDARGEENWTAACEYVSKVALEFMEELALRAKIDHSCGTMLKELTDPNAQKLNQEEAAKADVRSLRVGEGRGFVLYTIENSIVLVMPMVEEGGVWKVSSTVGTRVGVLDDPRLQG